jgi:hypothetical protein
MNFATLGLLKLQPTFMFKVQNDTGHRPATKNKDINLSPVFLLNSRSIYTREWPEQYPESAKFRKYQVLRTSVV